ncbi:MAG TPA: fluoride efflux transporter CrcB [Candidatus Binatia bacterium]|nr:fluoride efflux transporter CrcB [Candidatus Binatia bacterium]
MPLALYVAAGGAIGAVARYLVAALVARSWSHVLPMGTLVVNVSGCFLIGAIAGAGESRALLTAETRAFLIVGILGGYTTFSAFGLEAFELLRRGELAIAATHFIVQCVAGTGAVAAGYTLTRVK